MSNNSRTRNVTINASLGIITQFLRIVIEFIIRTIFIKKLGAEYLGVNGLFTNILTILSFAELGIGNAIIYHMYKEISNKNIEKIKSLMQFYKKSYITIGIIILFLGGILTPFVPFLINGKTNIKESIYIIYLLFLLNTGTSYFFAYKKAIISAHQKEYIINLYRLFVEVIKLLTQVMILFLFKNFILYLLVQVFITLLDNILLSLKANKMYPYLTEKKIESLEKSEKINLFKSVKSLVLYKFGSIILNGTDNIIISKMIDLITVGLISNFSLILNTIVTLVGSLLNGITASIGNLNVESNTEKKEKIFNELFVLCVWIYGVCAISFYTLSNDFIYLWIGENYRLPLIVLFAMSLHLYINGVQFAGYTYRTTTGLFNKGKYCALIAAILNIILSIILCNYFGLFGILLATSIARLCTTTWYDIHLVYKFEFKKSPTRFYIKYLLCFVLIFIIGIISVYLCSFISVCNIGSFISKTFIVFIVSNILLLCTFIKTQEFQDIFKRMRRLLCKKK